MPAGNPDQSFERLFEAAAARAAAHTLENEDDQPIVRAQKRQRTEEDELRRKKDGMTSADAIQRILLAQKDQDYFRMLALPPPDVDALGRPKWDITPAEVSKAYRKLSVLVHPDKNPGDEAREAFEALNKAHRILKDPGELESLLKSKLDEAIARKEEAEAKASLEERLNLSVRQQEEARALRKKEAEELHAEIVRQMKGKQEMAKKKKMKMQNTRRQRLEEEEVGGGGSRHVLGMMMDDSGDDDGDEKKNDATKGVEGEDEDEEEEGRRRRMAIAKRRQQQQKRRPTAP